MREDNLKGVKRDMDMEEKKSTAATGSLTSKLARITTGHSH